MDKDQDSGVTAQVGDGRHVEHQNSQPPEIDSKLLDAADAFLTELLKMKPRPKRVRGLAVATFAAFEARRDLGSSEAKKFRWVYILFLAGTILSPFIVARVPREVQGVVWDGVGIGSTMALLAITYGWYTVKMLFRGLREVLGSFSNPQRWTGTIRDWGTKPSTETEDDSPSLELGLAIVLLLIGGFVAWNAWGDLRALYKLAAVRKSDVDLYSSYFEKVWFLSALFIFMDMSVARFNKSHSETYIATSSAFFVTIPMFIGISLVGCYLLAQWPISGEMIAFASGALTFQMIISNVVFIIMKNNWVYWYFYGTVDTTCRS